MKFFYVMGLVAAFISVHSEARIWTSSKGKILEADYVGDAGDKVVVELPNGKTRKIPVDAFCKADQEFIFNQKPPSIDISVKRGTSRDSVKGDIDDKVEQFKFEIELEKKSNRPYTKKLKIELYVFGYVLHGNMLKLLDKQQEKFELSEPRGSTYSLKGKKVRIQHDPSGYGTKYDSYFICISTEDGTVLEKKGQDKFEEYLPILRESEVDAYFTMDMEPSDRKPGVYYNN